MTTRTDTGEQTEAGLLNHYWISLPYATFGVGARDGVVVETAPIAKWARGKALAAVLAYYRKKGACIYDYQARCYLEEPQHESKWLPDKSGYETPEGIVVRLWNGPQLHGHRNSVQQQAQREIQQKAGK